MNRVCPICKEDLSHFEQFGFDFYTCFTNDCCWNGVTASKGEAIFCPLEEPDWYEFRIDNGSTLSLLERWHNTQAIYYKYDTNDGDLIGDLDDIIGHLHLKTVDSGTDIVFENLICDLTNMHIECCMARSRPIEK